MALFKSKEEKAQIKFDKGADLIAQKKFDEARANLMKSIDKGNADPEVYILIEMIDLREKPYDLNQLTKAMEVFSKYPDVTVKYGVYDVNSTKLSNEAKLKIDEIRAEKAAEGEPTEVKGKELIRCGNAYMTQIGDENLLMEEIFLEKKVSGRINALTLNALGYETLAQAIKWDDSKKAADYSQQAANYRRDLNDSGMVSRDESFVAGLAKTVHCWFCDKEISGENVHFVPMQSRITKPIQGIIDKEDLPIKSSGSGEIYACRACYSAIDNRDQVYLGMSKKYTDEQIMIVVQHVNALESRVTSLERRLSELIRTINKM